MPLQSAAPVHAKVRLERYGELAVAVIDNQPVNALSRDVIVDLDRAITSFEADRSLRALILMAEGRTFVAGGDIGAFDEPGFSTEPFNRVLERIEALERPVVAALHGTVLGGGLELALACHWRVATEGVQLGFPEVKIGLIPGSTGTQRLPRLIGVEKALEMISSGRSIDSRVALREGLVDVVTGASLKDSAFAFVRDLLARGARVPRLSQLPVRFDAVPDGLFATALARARKERAAYPAAVAAVEAVLASSLPYPDGVEVEARLFEALRHSRQSRALRHLFFARREAPRIPGLPRDVEPREIRSVGVIGAGTMGRGIAVNFLNAGMPTVLIETSQAALDLAFERIGELYLASVAKGKLTQAQMQQRMQLLSGSTSYTALTGCDLVIEAVYEDMALKKQVCAHLGAVCAPGVIIATNTSTLDVDALAKASGRESDFIGMHFFSPAHVMKLLEVIRGAQTSAQVLATSMQLARRIGKTAVVSGVCYGFIGNRMAEVYMREAEFLMMEGASPAQVDAAVEELGMSMGPCRMLDMAGIDVGAKTVIECGLVGGLPPDAGYRALVRRLFELGRYGQKTGAGYYRYEGRTPLPDPQTQRIARELAIEHNIPQRTDIGSQEIVERLLYPMINEAARILEEGIAYRPGDIDVVWTAGYGFPDHQGGLLFYADEIGIRTVVARLEAYARKLGNRFGYWTPANLLVQLASSGNRITEWRRSS
ncbi:enoyl-CoA hydratase [Paraburkholderia silviterrae]|uniref:Enoyl-CoA hydratase n=2 Tax=Paraburkholderia silviterrae TaxID=2528715 RepID=A0A4R5M245_9BURK|nr:enoyl-CoA hydratase [Paraburkholderia silviterrae]